MAAYRVTLSMHNQRVNSKGKAIKASHNDGKSKKKNFKFTRDDSKNVYWHIWGKEDISFEEVEERFYDKKFGKWMAKENEKHIKSRHYDRIKTANTLINGPRTAPEETLIYLGDMDNNAGKALLTEFTNRYIEYINNTYPQIQFLDAALHDDEEGAPHVHLRKVYWAKQPDGTICPAEDKALEQMDIPLPDPSKKPSRWNNRKMTLDADLRKKAKEIANDLGIEILPEAEDSKHKNRDMATYLGRKKKELEKEIEELEQKNQELLEEQEKLLDENQGIRNQVNQAEAARQGTIAVDVSLLP